MLNRDILELQSKLSKDILDWHLMTLDAQCSVAEWILEDRFHHSKRKSNRSVPTNVRPNKTDLRK